MTVDVECDFDDMFAHLFENPFPISELVDISTPLGIGLPEGEETRFFLVAVENIESYNDALDIERVLLIHLRKAIPNEKA